MFSDYLRETSIHGLKYVLESRNPLVKLAWLACILTCISIAVWIIFLNVEAWNNSPAVITTVGPALVKGEDLMPMVTVCPLTFSYTNMVTGILAARPDLVDRETVHSVKVSLAKMALTGRVKSYWPKYNSQQKAALNIFANCTKREDNQTYQGCDLVQLLYRLAATSGDDGMATVRDYLGPLAVSKDKPNLQDMETDLKEKYGQLKAFPAESTPPTADSSRWVNTRDLYLLFFPVYDPDFRRPAPLQGLESYEHPDLPEVTESNFPTLLGHMVDWQVTSTARSPLETTAKVDKQNVLILGDLIAAARSSLVGSLVGYFNLTVEDRDHVFRLVNALVPEPIKGPVFVNNDPHKLACGNEALANEKSVGEICSSEDAVYATVCRRYCELVQDTTALQKASEVLEMALERAGPAPPSLLPACARNGKPLFGDTGCWKRVVNERGVCFTALTSHVSQAVEGVGPDFAFEFAMDFSGEFDDTNYERVVLTQKEIAMLFTPANQFTIGQYTEVKDSIVEYVFSPADRADDIKVEMEIEYFTDATAEFRAMNPSKRGCYYEDELQLDIFSSYSEPNCVLECAFQRASKACGCVPWHLKEHFPRTEVCEAYGMHCFKEETNKKGRSDTPCERACLPDCKIVNYRIVKTEESRPSRLRLPENFSVILTNKTATASEDSDVFKALEIFRGKPDGRQIGIVRVYLNRKSTLRFISTATVTLVDMISNIGGILGLFCGFSILSAVEIIYWITNFILLKRL